MRWLITGAEGFVGNYLVPYLLETDADADILALVLRDTEQAFWPTADHVSLLPADLREPESFSSAVEDFHPDFVLHLAALSSVGKSWANPAPIYEVNVLGQLHLLEACRRMKTMPRVVIASSSEIYGREDHGGRPITEDAALKPASPYAVSKAAQDLQAFQYFQAFGMPTIRLRLFNHTGPGRPDTFAASSFARQIARAEAGLIKPVLRVGNIDVFRDFSDVRDIVRAWRLAAVRGKPGRAYNVCSGTAVAIRDILETLLALSDTPIRVETDPARFRPGEIPRIVGDAHRFRTDCGWRPEIPLKRTLKDLLDEWRARVGTEETTGS